MKKSLLALAVLGAFAGAASAQSSVTVYGIADVGVNSTNYTTAAGGNGRVIGLTSGGDSTSRIGFRGIEDLGGGMSALFQLEMGLSMDTGALSGTATYPGFTTASNMFNRISVVGLQGGFGTVKLGRQTTVLKDAGDVIDPFGQTGSLGNLERIFYFAGANTAANSSYGQLDGGRVSNTIKYTSPSFSGFSAQAAYTFGENTGDSTSNGQTGLGLGYINGPLNVQFGYQNARVNSAAPFGPGATAPAGFTNISSAQSAFLGGVYDFGGFKLHAAYADNRANAILGADPKSRNGMIGVTVPLGAGALIASYAVNNVDTAGVSSADSQQFAIEYDYNLSKRTNLYTGYARTNNDANANLGGPGAIGYTTTAAGFGTDVSVINVGIRHRF